MPLKPHLQLSIAVFLCSAEDLHQFPISAAVRQGALAKILLGDGGERRALRQGLAAAKMLCSTSCFLLSTIEVLRRTRRVPVFEGQHNGVKRVSSLAIVRALRCHVRLAFPRGAAGQLTAERGRSMLSLASPNPTPRAAETTEIVMTCVESATILKNVVGGCLMFVRTMLTDDVRTGT